MRVTLLVTRKCTWVNLRAIRKNVPTFQRFHTYTICTLHVQLVEILLGKNVNIPTFLTMFILTVTLPLSLWKEPGVPGENSRLSAGR